MSPNRFNGLPFTENQKPLKRLEIKGRLSHPVETGCE
jgi:hypothetical protein